MKIKCLVVDDKPLAVDVLADYIKKIPYLELTAATTNPVEALSILQTTKIDLVFLDIQMPELNGLEFIKIAKDQCKVILTTAYAKYALDGYEHDAIDYLLKPIPFDRFYRAAEKARQILYTQDSKQGGNIATDENLNRNTAYLFVKTEHRIQKINIDDILYVEGLQNYVSIQLSAERILSLQTLKSIRAQLPPDSFIRIHKSYIIATRHIIYIEKSRVTIGSTVLPIGNSYREGFYKLIEKR